MTTEEEFQDSSGFVDTELEDATPDLAQAQVDIDDGKAPGGGAEKKNRPRSVLELLDYAYSEDGRRLTLARRDLRALTSEPADVQFEIRAVERLAAGDPLLAVPPVLLSAVAELGALPSIRQRILELVLRAFAHHKVFEGKLPQLNDATIQPALSAREVSDSARSVTADALGVDPSSFTAATRERLRVNAVTAFLLLRVLRDRWSVNRFVGDMSELVWHYPSHTNPIRTAGILAMAKNPDVLSQLSRHFETRLRDVEQELGSAHALAAQLGRRVEMAVAEKASLASGLEAAHTRVAELTSEIAHLSQRLIVEQSGRVVDKSHLVDDYEILRTQVIRRLTSQVELLSDGLHALRNGSTGVAEEFVDRALTAIKDEVSRLKDVDGASE